MAEAPGERGHHHPISSHVEELQNAVIRKLNPNMYKTERVGSLTIYKMLLKHVKIHNSWEYGATSDNVRNKVIMLVGETGSGKTSLINAMINFIFGIDWKHDDRIKLVAEKSGKSQAHSQTSKVTTYQINHEDSFRIPYSVTIIDTPGFGDTRGIRQDHRIRQQIRSFFQKCAFTEIDAICFVVQSSLARLTPTQIYIYDSILSIFGKNIKDNIVFFTTFADVGKPLVLTGISEVGISCAQSKDGSPVYFKINNSMVFAENCPSEEDRYSHVAHEIQWLTGMENLEKFFRHFLPDLTGKQVSLTKDVLEETNALEVLLEGLMLKLEDIMLQQQELEEIEKAVRKHRLEIEQNENFEFQVNKTAKRQVETTDYSTNCRTCSSTCHRDCHVLFELFLYFCEVFYWDATCKVCGHSKDQHAHQQFYWETFIEHETINYAQVKSDYEEEDNVVMTHADVLQKLKANIEKAEEESELIIKEASIKIKKLQQIALKPNPMSAVLYIDLLIDAEKREGSSGFLERIQMLERAKRKIQIAEQIAASA